MGEGDPDALVGRRYRHLLHHCRVLVRLAQPEPVNGVPDGGFSIRSEGADEHTVRHVTDVGLQFVRSFEGFRPEVYICAAGWPTIGYGHVVLGGEDFSDGVAEEQALALLARDVVVAERSVLRNIRVPLSDEQFDSLASFCFNLGGGALQRSALRARVNRKEHDAVPPEFLKWCRAAGVILKGLLRRRRAEADLYVAGTL